ncbi:MAG: hypothetical protein ACKVRO_10255 [Micropepsaceae bacterium]
MKRDWLREPIVVLPATIALGFLLCLPFLLFGTQGAPAFYGAFFAALTGLAGILAGALYNASLTRRRDDRQERIKVLAAARVAKSELSHVLSSLDIWRAHSERLVPIPDHQKEAFSRFLNEDSFEDDGGTIQVSRAVYLEVIRFQSKTLATPVTDAHLLELCRQSEEISNHLTGVMQYRAAFVEEVERTFSEFNSLPSSAKISVHDWMLMGAPLAIVGDELQLLIPAISKFIEKHAGDFA